VTDGGDHESAIGVLRDRAAGDRGRRAGIALAENGLEHPHWQGTASRRRPRFSAAESSRDTGSYQGDPGDPGRRFQQSGIFAVEQGEQLWSKPDGAAGKSCAGCHQDAAATMKGSAPRRRNGAKSSTSRSTSNSRSYLPHRTDEGRAVEVRHIRIDRDDDLCALPIRGMPIAPRVDGPMTPWFEKGKQLYYTRHGQLDLACASCHEKNHGKNLRADFLSQGQSTASGLSPARPAPGAVA